MVLSFFFLPSAVHAREGAFFFFLIGVSFLPWSTEVWSLFFSSMVMDGVFSLQLFFLFVLPPDKRNVVGAFFLNCWGEVLLALLSLFLYRLLFHL